MTGNKGFYPGMLAVVALVALVPVSAQAAPPDFLLKVPETHVAPGAGAGELDGPRGVAADPENGHIYIAETENSRISEYTAWGLFVKSWGWGVEDGSSELQICGPSEPEADPDPSLCQIGSEGASKGQLSRPNGLAVDSAGAVYVIDRANLRVQKFSPEGDFLLMFGGDVNKTKVDAAAPAAQRNVCVEGSGDVCQAGTSGEGPSQLSGTIGDYIAYSPAEGGRILVGDKGGIQVFDLNGNWVKTITFEGPLAAFAGQTVNALDIDKDGNVYFALSGLEDVYKLDPAGAPAAPGKPGESKFEVHLPAGVAVDAEGSVWAIDNDPTPTVVPEAGIAKFDAVGNKLLPTPAEEVDGEIFPFIPFHGPAITALATNLCVGSEEPGNLYVGFFKFAQESYVNAYGTPPIGCEDPPERDPEVLEQFATSVGREEAIVKARINPLFWPDATYYVEYGTGKCSEGGCPNKAPVSPLLLTDKSINAPVRTAGVVLDGLASGATYHYRFVAESGGGGPVFGIDPDGRDGPAKASLEEGLEATFRTARHPDETPICPNGAVRKGESAKLPDCRAYEMVSPLDKGGGDVALWQGRNALFPFQFEIHQSAPSGDLFTYTSAFAFDNTKAAPFVAQYLTERSAAGWSGESISAPLTQSPVSAEALFANEFNGFTEDLCQGWIRHFSVGPLAPGAIEKYANLYRRQNCSLPPTYEALTTEKPPNRPADRYSDLRIQEVSADGSHTIFTVNDKLHTTDPPIPTEDDLFLYEHTNGELRFVCYLPDGSEITTRCAAGTVAGGGGGNTSSVRNAISADGSRIFWSHYTGTPGIGDQAGAPGPIYVRIDGTETKKVSTAVAPDPAWYWTAAEDGSKVIFEFASGPHKDELYELDVDTETPTLIAAEVEGSMGASEDASRLYLASKEDLDDAGPATAGDHNLYLYEADPGGGGGDFTFVMELSGADIGGSLSNPAPVDELPFQRAAYVTPGGLHASFVSASPTPTDYDNRDANSGEPAQEVYLYGAAEDELRCVSCNPSGARPVGEDLGFSGESYFAVARIQGWELRLHAPRVLSEDGTRVFFESFEALVPRDTNSTWDVYQWEEEGKGTCKASSETFSEDSGGCVDLISSGTSTAKSTFLDADPSGDNIFFSTQSSLVKADYGLNDVYVARVGGGFPEPQQTKECEGEACQSPPPPPPEVTPSTELSQGDGNVKPKARRCPKGKRRVKRAGKVKCVKRRAAHKRRAGR